MTPRRSRSVGCARVSNKKPTTLRRPRPRRTPLIALEGRREGGQGRVVSLKVAPVIDALESRKAAFLMRDGKVWLSRLTMLSFLIWMTSISMNIYRVTQHVGSNLPLTSTLKFHFGLARSGQARPKRNFCLNQRAVSPCINSCLTPTLVT